MPVYILSFHCVLYSVLNGTQNSSLSPLFNASTVFENTQNVSGRTGPWAADLYLAVEGKLLNSLQTNIFCR